MSPSRGSSSLLALSLCAVLAAGCGGTDRTGEATTAESGGPSPPASARARATAYAKAVNLRASDVPYFEALEDEAEDDPGREARNDRELRECVGEGGFQKPLAEVSSAEYGTQVPGEALQVSSSVEVAADPAEALRGLRLIRTRRAERCLRRVFVAAAEEEESSTAEVRRVSVSRLDSPAPEIDDGFAFRFTAAVLVHPSSSELTAYRPAAESGPSAAVKVYADILGFVVGPASITITATGVSAPVARNLERNLLVVLHERALQARP
jgi:hypothetical protein